MNKNLTVIIPTAGLGSRMGSLTNFLNKSLLPFKHEPVISHIIKSFPNNTKFIIPVGYKKDQVIDFCKLTYPEKNIEFVEIADYQGIHTGPGHTIKQCLDKINDEFFYIPCDSYYQEKLPDNLVEDTYFIKKVNKDMNYHYTTFMIDNNKLVDYKFKKNTPEEYFAFTGIMFIKNYNAFKQRLINNNSPEIIYTIELKSSVQIIDSWLDFGNFKVYNDNIKETSNYDFTKTDEITYLTNNKVIKYWKNDDIAQKKYKKYLTNPDVYPYNVIVKNNWLAHDFTVGKTLYEKDNVDMFPLLLTWLDKKVWKTNDVDLMKESTDFYKEKTLGRVKKFIEKYPKLNKIVKVNDVFVKDYTEYLNKIDWDLLITETISGHVHGDCIFDNIIINDQNEFKIIDWRHEFGQNTEYGDIYYDLAKLYGSLMIDYTKIKKNQFKIEIFEDEVRLTIPHIDNFNWYKSKLFEYIKNKGYSEYKVKLLTPIIFWNMAPLHKEPFDQFLWYLGIMLFEDIRL